MLTWTCRKRGLFLVASALACNFGLDFSATMAAVPSWKPEKNVEIILGTGPGSSHDRTARLIQLIWQKEDMIGKPVTVVNKPGGGGTISSVYLSQHVGDPYYLKVTSPALLTAHIRGTTQLNHTTFTPIAQLISEYIAFVVKADSPLKNAKDLVEGLRNDPASLSFGYATGPGTTNHLAIAAVAKAAALDFKKLKMVAFDSGGKSTTALLGGHVDIVPTAVSVADGLRQQGTVRVIAVTSVHRLGGAFAQIPTWKELGVDMNISNWRGIIGAPELSAAQIAFWDRTFKKLITTEEWRVELERNFWENDYLSSADARKFLAAEYQNLKTLLVELSMAKL